MEDKLEIGFDAPGLGLIEKAISSLDRLQTTMAGLGGGPASASLKSLQSQVQVMQASMTAGFMEVETRLDNFQNKVKQAAQTTASYSQQRLAASQAALAAERSAAAESERIAKAAQQADASRTANASSYAQQRLASSQAALAAERLNTSEMEKAAKAAEAADAARTSASTSLAQQRLAASQASLVAERALAAERVTIAKAAEAAELAAHNQRTSQGSSYTATRLTQAQQRLAQEREEAAESARLSKAAAEAEKLSHDARLADNARYIQQRLASSQAALAAERAVMAEQTAATERQRVLNTSFLTASPTAQLSRVNEAKVYGSLGGDVSAKYGTQVAGLTQTTAAYDKLKQASDASAVSVDHHSKAMSEAHAFARGLSGALGQLWTTYGSLAPLLAGAAIAGSLRKIYEVGKEVEYQLTFVKALTETPVDLNKFLSVTAGTVVSVKEAAEGMRALAQNGLDAQKSLTVLPSILNLATIGEMKVADAALSATGVMTAFNMQISDIERIGDIFAKAAATSNTSVAGMTESMKTASTASSLFGVSIEETAASIGILAKLNITGTAAGTSFRNILKDLYEPTKKQGDALKAMGISTRDGNDQLKNYVQVLSEIREKTAGLSEGGRLNFLSQISDERGAKALISTLTNWTEFIGKIDEAKNAAGFTAKAVTELENSVEGASKRMANSWQNTFIKAFAESSPIMQKLVTELGDIGRSGGLLEFLSSATEGVANLIRSFIENIQVIKNLAIGYASLKIVEYLAVSYSALAQAMNTTTVAATAQAAVDRGLATAKATLTGSTIAATTATAGGAVAAEVATGANAALSVSTVTLAGSMRLLMAALGPIALAIAAAVTVYELFIKRSSEVDKELMKSSNTLHVINEELDRQIAKLNERNKAWNPASLKFDLPVIPEESEALGKARAEVSKIEKALAAAEAKATAIGTGGAGGMSALRAAERANSEVLKYQTMLDQKKAILTKALDAEEDVREKRSIVSRGKELQEFRESKANLLIELEKFKAKADERSLSYVNGQKVEGKVLATPAQAEKYRKADSLIEAARLATDAKGVQDVMRAWEQLRGELNSVSASYEKADPKKLLDQYKAAIEKETTAFKTYETEQKGTIERLRLDYAAGTIGELELIEKETEALQQLELAKNATAKAKSNLAVGLVSVSPDHRAEVEKYNTEIEATKAKYAEIDYTRETRLANQKILLEQEVTKQTIEELNLRGEHRAAAEAEAAESYGKTLRRMQADKANLAITGRDETPEFSSLSRAIDSIQSKIKAKINAGALKDITAAVEKATGEMGTAIADLNEKGAAGAGIFDKWGIAQVAIDIEGKTLPALQKLLAEAKELGESDLGAAKFSVSLEKQIAKTQNTLSGFKRELTSNLFGNLAKSIASMGSSFKVVADAVDGVGKAFMKLQMIQELEAKGTKIDTQEKLGAYGDMTDAAKGFFSEGSNGYKTLQGAAQVFHAAQIAMNLIEMGQLAIKAVMTQAQGDAYSAWARMAAMAAVMAGLGFAVGGGFSNGGGKGKTAAEVQQEQGTGSVFGDTKAKSDSISKSLETLKNNSNLMLPINQGMLASLRNIEASMVGLTNLIIRTPGVAEGTNLGIATGQLNKGMPTDFLSKLGTNFMQMTFPLIGGALASFMNNLWGKTTQSIVDSGIQYGGSLASLQQGKGYNQYASVDTTTSSFFGLVKNTSNSVVTSGLTTELSNQFGLIFTNLEKAMKAASGSLGSSAEEVMKSLDSLVVAPTTLSLKGLTGNALTEALNAVISKTMDEIATAALPGLDDFRQVGEGYAQTVLRVASSVELAKFELEKLNITAINFKDIVNKQGDVGAELVRQSLTRVETFGTALTGVGQIMQGMEGTATDLAKAYKELTDIRVQMGKVGLQGTDLGVPLLKGAGGTSELSAGLTSYFENYFTEAERTAAETKILTQQFSALGFELPKSKDAFRALVESTGTGTAESAKLTGQLLTLADAFSQVATAQEEVKNALAAQRTDMQIQILNLEGKSAEALAMTRQRELAALDSSLVPLQKRIYQLQDEAAALEIVNRHKELDIQLLEAQGKTEEATAARRAQALVSLDAYSKGVQQQIYDAQDAAAAAKVAEQHRQIDIQLLEALGKTEQATSAKRKLALESLDAYSKGIQEQIYAAQDAAAALAVQKQHREMDVQLLEALSAAEQSRGEGAAKLGYIEAALAARRAIALEGLDDYSQGVQKQIWAVQDATSAQKKSVDTAKTNLQKAYDAETSAIQKVIDKTQAFVDSLKDMMDSLLTGELSPMSKIEKFQYGKANLPNIEARAMAGDEKALTDLQDFLSLAKELSPTKQAYGLEFGKVEEILGHAQTASQLALSMARSQLDVLKESVKGLLDVNDSVLSVADAIKAMQDALASGLLAVAGAVYGQNPAASAAAVSTSTASSQAITDAGPKQVIIADVYKRYREAETAFGAKAKAAQAAGFKGTESDYSDQFGGRFDLNAELYKALTAKGYLATEYMSSIPQLAVGTNNVPEDMLAFIHKGEAVVPAPFNPYNGPVATTGNATTGLEAIVGRLIVSAEATAAELADIKDILDRITRGENAVYTKAG